METFEEEKGCSLERGLFIYTNYANCVFALVDFYLQPVWTSAFWELFRLTFFEVCLKGIMVNICFKLNVSENLPSKKTMFSKSCWNTITWFVWKGIKLWQFFRPLLGMISVVYKAWILRYSSFGSECELSKSIQFNWEFTQKCILAVSLFRYLLYASCTFNSCCREQFCQRFSRFVRLIIKQLIQFLESKSLRNDLEFA